MTNATFGIKFSRPCGAVSDYAQYPRLAPWASFFCRFAAGLWFGRSSISRHGIEEQDSERRNIHKLALIAGEGNEVAVSGLQAFQSPKDRLS